MPIVLTKDEWDRIVQWTKPEEVDAETLRIREYIRYLDQNSHEMTKSWPNSLENVNKRNEEVRRARIEAAEQANSKFYRRYVKLKQEEQERLMYSARDSIFKNKDAPKLLLSAVIETVTLQERAEQMKFNKMLQQQRDDQKKQDDDRIIRQAREWNELMDQRAKRRFEVNKEHQREILEQAKEYSDRMRKEHEDEVNMQKIDNEQAGREMMAIKKFEEDFKAAEKARIWSDMELSKHELETLKKQQAQMDHMDDMLQDVLLRSRARVEQRRKQTEREVREEKLRVLEKISQKLESGDAAREAQEQRNLDKAIAEKEAADEARRQAQRQKEEQHRAMRVASREQFLRDQAQRLHEQHTMQQWELVNRFKNQEIYDDFKEQLREKKARKIKEYKEEILRLWKERDDREAQEKAESRHFYGKLAESKLRDADNKLLTHAAALIDEARANGRPDLPLHKAIDRYCKLYRLYSMPDLPKSMKEHFSKYAPWDGSKPDPDFQMPTPPPPERPPNDDIDFTGKSKPESSKPEGKKEEKKKEEKKKAEKKKEADYKRAGPANGLQRKVSPQPTRILPPIKVVPCQTADCKCILKPK